MEQNTQWANRAELYVGLVKEDVSKGMRYSGSPLVLWDYAAERRAHIMRLTALDLFRFRGAILIRLLSEMKGIFPTYANLLGTNGSISMMILLLPAFHLIRPC